MSIYCTIIIKYQYFVSIKLSICGINYLLGKFSLLSPMSCCKTQFLTYYPPLSEVSGWRKKTLLLTIYLRLSAMSCYKTLTYHPLAHSAQDT
jgi:hypothetical protein